MAGRIELAVTERHKELTKFHGEWNLEQRFFVSPDVDPMVSRGRTISRVLLGGRAMFMESELEGGYSAVVFATWNVSRGRYEGYFMDIYSFDGFDPLIGATATNAPVAPRAKVDLSDKALFGKGATRERIWTSRLTVPRIAPFVEGATPTLLGVDQVPVEIIEHRINANHWVLNCISFDALNNPYVQMENTYTR